MVKLCQYKFMFANVIGKGGQTIKNIQNTSGARIKVSIIYEYNCAS